MNPVIEAFRGAAALAVLLHHYSYLTDGTLTGGWLHALHNGVDLFFVITGYLFAPHLLGEQRQHVGSFAIRRVFRLYPLYMLSLAVAVAKDWGEREGIVQAAVLHLVFAQALPIHGLQEVGFFSQIYWTLPVEVAFYALVAVALAMPAAAPRQPQPGRRIVLVGALALLGFVVVFATRYDPRSESWVVWQAQLPALLAQFWFGILVHRVRPWLQRSAGARAAALATGLGMLVALGALYPMAADGALTARPFGLFNLASGVGWALLFGACVASPRRMGPRATRVALGMGSISYGMYLFHEWTLKSALRLLPGLPVIVQLGAAFVMVVALALLLHRTVEAPLRRRGRILAARVES